MEQKYDFCGWATRNDLPCSDGRVIRHGAFKDCDGLEVPLVWNHSHGDPEKVLGKALLHNCDEGVYCYGTFNDTSAGQVAKVLVQHGDIKALSIYANQLKQIASDVVHGVIREVSLVHAGANPGAYIETIIAHSADCDEEAVIFFGENLELQHSEEAAEVDETESKEEILEHKEGESEMAESKEKTVQEVFDEMTEEQKTVVYAMIGQAVEDATSGKDDEEDEEMKHNVFDADVQDEVLTHAAMETILSDAKRFGSLKESFIQHSEEYGIKDIDWLFPEAKSVNGAEPAFIKRNPDAWVSVVMNGVHHTPFSRIKMMFADLREDDARAKGYAVKGKLKKEEVFGLIKRTVEPTTIYKKQKLDRDDIIDITDFNVVSWLKGEMRMMLEEEIARAILFGDGRLASSDDKIKEANIIPIAKDASLYTIVQTVTPASGESLSHALITAAVKGQNDYEGSGNTILFTSNNIITDMLLMEDKNGIRLYKDVRDLALAMSVNRIVKVPASIIPSGMYGIIVDLNDYNVGADKGGSISMFDDFDIDYNQQKYLMETRCSGALTKPFSAIVLKEAVQAAG